MQRRLTKRDGFTLVETLAAFVILTLALSQLLAGVSGAAHNESRADFLLRASRDGQSHLSALGLEAPISVGETSGRYDDGLEWILSVDPPRLVKGKFAGGAPIAEGYLARLTISGPPARTNTLTLTTIAVVAPRDSNQ
jgi:general secretion pathway protein I